MDRLALDPKAQAPMFFFAELRCMRGAFGQNERGMCHILSWRRGAWGKKRRNSAGKLVIQVKLEGICSYCPIEKQVF